MENLGHPHIKVDKLWKTMKNLKTLDLPN